MNIMVWGALLGCFGWQSHSSDAQDSGVPLSFETNSSIVDPKWLDDSTTFAFTTYDDDAYGVLMWYLYDINTELITQTNIYPMPASLANFDFDAVQVADWPGRGMTVSVSPNGSYLVYLSDVKIEWYHVLGIANIATGEFFITDIRINGSMKIFWSPDESGFLVETGNPVEFTIHYSVQNIDPSLNHITSDFLTLSSYGIIYLYVISRDGNFALAWVIDDNRPDKLLIWNLQDPSQNTVINDVNYVEDARFSLSDNNIILAINEGRLVGYDIRQDPQLLFDEPLGISNIKSALFSPDQQYLAVISEIDDYRDGVTILPLVDLFPMPLPETG